MDDLAQYLRDKGLDVHPAAGQEIVVHCVFCEDGDPKGRGKLYLNTESWLYDCKRCLTKGNRRTLLRHFGDEDTTNFTPAEDPSLRRQIYQEYAEHAEHLLANNDAMLTYLLKRGLSPETIEAARLGFVPKNYGICDSLPSEFSRAALIASGLMTDTGKEFFQKRIIIPYLSSGAVVQVRGKDVDGKYFTPTGANVRLYNIDALRDADKVIITEGEFDCLILAQFLADSPEVTARSIAVVGLAGANALPENFENLFGHAKRVYIGLDNDDTGRACAVKIKSLLGSKSRIIELPRDVDGTPIKDWTDFLKDGQNDWRDIMRLVHEADMTGKRIYSMQEAGARWERNRTAKPGVKTGFPTFDAIVKDGLRPGNLMIPLAKTGTGKTLFLSNLAYNMRSRRVLFITLEMMADEIYAILRKISRFYHPDLDDREIQAQMPYLRIVDENRLSPEDFALLVEEYAEEVGEPPEVVFVDYIGYYSKGMRGTGSYEKTSNAVMQLKEEAKRHEVAIIAPHQVNRNAKEGKPLDADEARDSGVVEETADFLVGLFKPSDAVDDASLAPGKVAGALGMSILKSRRGGKGKVVQLHMSMASLVIVDDADRRNVARVDQENASLNRGLSYEDLYREQRLVANQQAQLRLIKDTA